MNVGEKNTSEVKYSLWSADKDTDMNPKEEKVITFMEGAKVMVLTGPLNLLLFCTPIAIISYFAAWPDAVTFIFSLLALAPLAERLGFVTEQLAIHTNETIGGLLNATFGNATELIVAITALARGLFRLVQLSLLGSVLSNMLLVLGTAFFFGGLKNKTQKFSKISSQTNATLLMLSTMAILFPTILSQSGEETTLSEIGFSRATSLILFCTYLAFLYFQLKTHKHLYEGTEEEVLLGNVSANTKISSPLYDPPASISSSDGVDSLTEKILDEVSNPKLELTKNAPPAPVDNSKAGNDVDDDEEEEEEEEDMLGFHYGLVWLAIITCFIAILSDAISDSIENAANSVGISGIFLAAIVLPIVGNAAEHAGAVMFAYKGKLDLSLGVAIGSSTQIALCVLPLLVLIGWCADLDMDLNFGAYESSTLFLSVVAVTFAIKDGTSNWLLGLTLVAAYLIIAIGFWAHRNDDLD